MLIGDFKEPPTLEAFISVSFSRSLASWACDELASSGEDELDELDDEYLLKTHDCIRDLEDDLVAPAMNL